MLLKILCATVDVPGYTLNVESAAYLILDACWTGPSPSAPSTIFLQTFYSVHLAGYSRERGGRCAMLGFIFKTVIQLSFIMFELASSLPLSGTTVF